MNSREAVKAAIAHRETERIPYFLDLCPAAWETYGKETEADNSDGFLDNDVLSINPVWWNWYDLDPTWREMDPPTCRPAVCGDGDYDAFTSRLSDARKNPRTRDKYFLVLIYGSHFEKAYFARGIENFMADLGGEPEFVRDLLDLIIKKNLVMKSRYA